MSYEAKQFLILTEFNLSIFPFVAHALGVISKKFLPNPF